MVLGKINYTKILPVIKTFDETLKGNKSSQQNTKCIYLKELLKWWELCVESFTRLLTQLLFAIHFLSLDWYF